MKRRFALPLLVAAAGAVFSVPAGASLRQIAVGNFYFEDETVGDGKVDAQVGDQLRFNVLDGGPGTPHTVDVDELGIHSGSLASGETFTTPPIGKAGTFILYCKPHDQRGHTTTLVVSGTSIITPTTAPPATTTTAPTTTTTAKPTTTTKPPATMIATVSAGGASSSAPTTTTTARPTTTTAPTTTSSVEGGTAPAPGDPAAASTTTSAGTGSEPATGDPAGGSDTGGTALAPVGRGTVDLASGPVPGSLDELLNRRLRGRTGPWTRSIRLALAALLPMALAAAVALRRWPGPPPEAGPPLDPDDQ
jgi:hypothetical protein